MNLENKRKKIANNISLLIEKEDNNSFLIIQCGEYFVQVAHNLNDIAKLSLEAVSNNFLPENLQINQKQIDALLKAGFELEPEYNYVKSFPNNVEIVPELVSVIILIFDGIYNVLKTDLLKFTFDSSPSLEDLAEVRTNDNKRRIIVVGVALAIFVLAFVIIKTYTNSHKDERVERIEKQFNEYNGTHINLTNYIKENMNDPDSYESVETKYWDLSDHLVVFNKYRGKNVFNATVTNSIKANVDMDGNIINIIETNP